jgi:methionyl-tRNA formyltransferase
VGRFPYKLTRVVSLLREIELPGFGELSIVMSISKLRYPIVHPSALFSICPRFSQISTVYHLSTIWVNMRIALFTTEGLPNGRAVRQLISDHAKEIAFVGISDTHRPQVGGMVGQVMTHLNRSGFWILPYLFVNFCLPNIVQLFSPWIRYFSGKKHIQIVSLFELCSELGIPVRSIENVNHPSVIEAMKMADVDLILSFHFDQIFKQKTLESVPLGGINVHPSLLPLHRGPFPTFHALMSPTPYFGVTAHQIAAKIDSGVILEQRRMLLPGDTTATKAAVVLFEEGRLCVERILSKIAETGQLPPGHPNRVTKYCPWPTQNDMKNLFNSGRRLVNWADVVEALALNKYLYA